MDYLDRSVKSVLLYVHSVLHSEGHLFPQNPSRQKNCLTEKLGHSVYRLEPEEAETVAVIRRVAAGKLAREELTEWIEANSRPIPET